MEHKIILCRGIQGSGKTTFAKKWVAEDPEHRVRFNNDDIRNMLGKYWVPAREPLVKKIKEAFLGNAIDQGYDIIIDNMNLNPKELKYYNDYFISLNHVAKSTGRYHSYTIEIHDFFTPLEECIARDAKRENPIGESIIRETYNKYKDILNG